MTVDPHASTPVTAEYGRLPWSPGVPPEEIRQRSTEDFMERVEAASNAEDVRHVLAGLLSTIDFKPSARHPEVMLAWADRVLTLLLNDGDQRGPYYPDGTHVRDLVAEAEAGDASDYG